MRLYIDNSAALAELLPCLRQESIATLAGAHHVASRQRFLARLIERAHLGNLLEHAYERGAYSLSRDWLVERLHVRTQGYTKLVEPFFETPPRDPANPDRPTGFSKKYGRTKWFRLRAEADEAARAVFASIAPAQILNADTGQVADRNAVSPNGIPDPLSKFLTVPSVIPLHRETIDDAIAEVNARSIDPDRQRRLVDVLHGCRKYTVTLGGLQNGYRESDSGRLEQTSPVHVIGLQRDARDLVFRGSGLVDYDFRSCFYNIFRSVCLSLDYPTPLIDDFLRDKDGWDARLLRVIGTGTAEQLKTIRLSWLHGAALRPNTRATAKKLLGLPAMQAMYGDRDTRHMHAEVMGGMERIRLCAKVRFCIGGTKIFQNVLGRDSRAVAGHCEDPRYREDMRYACSHLLTGYEQFAIRTVCQHVPGLTAIIYDGFIAPPMGADQVQWLEQHLREISRKELGFELDLPIKVEPFPPGHRAGAARAT